MNYGVQFKVRGDDFGGHFINGISMADSESIWKCRLVSADDEKNVYVKYENNKLDYYMLIPCHDKMASRERRELYFFVVSAKEPALVMFFSLYSLTLRCAVS